MFRFELPTNFFVKKRKYCFNSHFPFLRFFSFFCLKLCGEKCGLRNELLVHANVIWKHLLFGKKCFSFRPLVLACNLSPL